MESGRRKWIVKSGRKKVKSVRCGKYPEKKCKVALENGECPPGTCIMDHNVWSMNVLWTIVYGLEFKLESNLV